MRGPPGEDSRGIGAGLSYLLSHLFCHLITAKPVTENDGSHGHAEWFEVQFRVVAVLL